MMPDVWTVMRKEWKEWLLMQGSSLRGGLTQLLIPIFILGVFLPAQVGRAWVEKPMFLIIWAWMPAFMVAALIADSFAGERERHTLETLLASRISDRAILFGKFGAGVAYGWGISMLGLLLGLVTVNVRQHGGPLILYSAGSAASAVVIAALAAGAIVAAGILVSLRASSVRQATQVLMLSVMGTFFGVMFGISALPQDFRARLLKTLATLGTAGTVIAGCALLAVLNAVLLSAAMVRFRRARLILD